MKLTAIVSRLSRPERLRTVLIGLAAAAPLLLGACSSDSSSGWTQLLGLAKQSFNRPEKVTLEQAASIPYATIGVQFGDNPETVLVLASDLHGTRLWTSAARISITTRNGRILQTAGMPKNLTATYIQGNDTLANIAPAAELATMRSSRLLDFREDSMFSIPVTCGLEPRGPAPIVILGKRLDTTRYDESCSSTVLDWSFTNSFWIDASGFVWKSIQHIHPDAGPVEIEVLRPPGS